MKRMILFLLAAAMTATVSAQPLERVAPEEVGLNPKQLAEADSMIEAAGRVRTMQVTYAARNSDFDGFAINEGDYLSLMDGKLFGTDKDISVLLEKLAQAAADRSAEFVTVFYGEDVTEEQAAQAEEIFSHSCPGVELSVLPGGQPVYYYIISIE